ncbi:helix-turn-helix domain-containing protein [Fructobacillus americanaquae]|uniref:Helix-turn-helix transcriptional regulator n=1 Tax=Fructobacillus americanaquae TaxID=2940302 RepID=A0ABY5C0G0_9LACO|nr:helix-turn-helix transcriptional regulator [Fructobacillus americanaquae]USS91559.1 helix-turn-helix transcriptional regulator [Fructobacillus americanaquae]
MEQNRIKQLRQEKKISLTKLASVVGISQPTLSRYESGYIKNGKHQVWQKLADFFDVPISHLQGLDTFSSQGIDLLIESLSRLNEKNNKENTPTIDGLALIVKLLCYHGNDDSVKALNSFFDNLNYFDPENPGVDLIVAEQAKENAEYKYLSTGGFSSTQALEKDTYKKAKMLIDSLSKLQTQQNKHK